MKCSSPIGVLTRRLAMYQSHAQKRKEQAQTNKFNHRTKVCTVQFLLRVHLHHIPIVYFIIFPRMIRRIRPASQIHVMTSSPSITGFCVCVEGNLDILPLAGALPLPL